MEDAEQVEIERLVRSPVPDCLAHGMAGVTNRGDGVGDDEGTKGGATDDDVFPRLPEHADIAAHCHETAKERPKHDNEADEETHDTPPQNAPDLGNQRPGNSAAVSPWASGESLTGGVDVIRSLLRGVHLNERFACEQGRRECEDRVPEC